MEVEACPVGSGKASKSLQASGEKYEVYCRGWFFQEWDRNFFLFLFFFLRGRSEARACLVRFATSFVSSTSSNSSASSICISCIIFIYGISSLHHFLILIRRISFRLHVSDNCSILLRFRFEKDKGISIVNLRGIFWRMETDIYLFKFRYRDANGMEAI